MRSRRKSHSIRHPDDILELDDLSVRFGATRGRNWRTDQSSWLIIDTFLRESHAHRRFQPSHAVHRHNSGVVGLQRSAELRQLGANEPQP
jgi:hypothetical protein